MRTHIGHGKLEQRAADIAPQFRGHALQGRADALEDRIEMRQLALRAVGQHDARDSIPGHAPECE